MHLKAYLKKGQKVDFISANGNIIVENKLDQLLFKSTWCFI